MTAEVKTKMFQKLAELSIVFILMAGGLFFFYNDNKQYREDDRLYRQSNDSRLQMLEQKVSDCQTENIKILREEVIRGHKIIERNTEVINNHFKTFSINRTP